MNEDQLAEPSDDDLMRLRALQRKIGGPNVQWGAREALEMWIVEQRMRADRVAARRLTRATWALAIATVALVIATGALVVITLVDVRG